MFGGSFLKQNSWQQFICIISTEKVRQQLGQSGNFPLSQSWTTKPVGLVVCCTVGHSQSQATFRVRNWLQSLQVWTRHETKHLTSSRVTKPQHYTSCFCHSKQIGNKTHYSKGSVVLVSAGLHLQTYIFSNTNCSPVNASCSDGLSPHASIYCTVVYLDLLWRRMKPLRATVESRRKLRGKLCEISDDTERPGLWTAEKSSSSVNPPRLEILSTARLSYKFSLVDSPFCLNFAHESS